MPQSRQIVHERARWRRIPARCPRIDLRMGRAANRSASKARIASFRGGPYSPFLDNFGLLTLVAECPLMAISGHPARQARESALPPKADIGAPPLTQLSFMSKRPNMNIFQLRAGEPGSFFNERGPALTFLSSRSSLRYSLHGDGLNRSQFRPAKYSP